MTRKRLILTLVTLTLLIAVSGLIWFFFLKSSPTTQEQSPENSQKAAEEPPQQPTPQVQAFNKELHSIDDPNSLWVVTNKKRPLPNGFVPPNLVAVGNTQMQAQAANATQELINAAKQQGVSLRTISGYRSFATQVNLYNSYVRTDGQAQADTYSARPGFSEHQTGLVVDMGDVGGRCDLEICYENTPGGQWLAANAHNYGFVIRYLNGKTPITGYQYEPWHLRYVGIELATELQKTGQTMEEFFGLSAAPGY